MSVLRYRLVVKEREPGELRRSLWVVLLFMLIAAWIHLFGFIIWQALDREAADAFYFELSGSSAPAIELTLTFNEPESIEAETIETEPILVAEEITEPAEEADPELAESIEAISEEGLNIQPPDLAAALIQSQLLPPPIEEGEVIPVVNPDPPITVESRAPELKSYYTTIQRAVNSRWIIPPAARTEFRPGRLIVDFTISREGELLRFVVIEGTGNPILDHAGQEALRAAAPFPPLPEELSKFSQLDIRMIFDYQAKYLPKKR